MKQFLSNLSFGLSIIALIALIGIIYCLFASTLTWVLICGGVYIVSLFASLIIEISIAPVHNT